MNSRFNNYPEELLAATSTIEPWALWMGEPSALPGAPELDHVPLSAEHKRFVVEDADEYAYYTHYPGPFVQSVDVGDAQLNRFNCQPLQPAFTNDAEYRKYCPDPSEEFLKFCQQTGNSQVLQLWNQFQQNHPSASSASTSSIPNPGYGGASTSAASSASSVIATDDQAVLLTAPAHHPSTGGKSVSIDWEAEEYSEADSSPSAYSSPCPTPTPSPSPSPPPSPTPARRRRQRANKRALKTSAQATGPTTADEAPRQSYGGKSYGGKSVGGKSYGGKSYNGESSNGKRVGGKSVGGKSHGGDSDDEESVSRPSYGGKRVGGKSYGGKNLASIAPRPTTGGKGPRKSVGGKAPRKSVSGKPPRKLVGGKAPRKTVGGKAPRKTVGGKAPRKAPVSATPSSSSEPPANNDPNGPAILPLNPRPAHMTAAQIAATVASLPTLRTPNKWEPAENGACLQGMLEAYYLRPQHGAGAGIEQRFRDVAARMAELLGGRHAGRTGAAVKNQWNRYLRVLSGFDERKVTGGSLSVSRLNGTVDVVTVAGPAVPLATEQPMEVESENDAEAVEYDCVDYESEISEDEYSMDESECDGDEAEIEVDECSEDDEAAEEGGYEEYEEEEEEEYEEYPEGYEEYGEGYGEYEEYDEEEEEEEEVRPRKRARFVTPALASEDNEEEEEDNKSYLDNQDEEEEEDHYEDDANAYYDTEASSSAPMASSGLASTSDEDLTAAQTLADDEALARALMAEELGLRKRKR